MAKSLHSDHWLVHVLRRAGSVPSEPLTLDPGASITAAWETACLAADLTPDRLAAHVADYFRLDLAALDEAEPAALRLVPEKVARRHALFPVRETDETLIVATSDPTNFTAEQALGFLSGRKAIFEVAPPGAVHAAIDAGYGPAAEREPAAGYDRDQSGGVEDAVSPRGEAAGRSEGDGDYGGDPSPVGRLLSLILRDALGHDADEVRIEPSAAGGSVRFRVDGSLRPYMELPRRAFVRLVSRIKTAGAVDVADRWRPQEGRVSLDWEGRTHDLSVSTRPASLGDGEEVVLRVLDPGRETLLELGYPGWELARLRQLLVPGGGLVVVAGPAGVGKRTTVGAIVGELSADGTRVASAATAAGDAAGYSGEADRATAAAAIEDALVREPDVLVVGEPEGKAAAEVVLRAVDAGRLVVMTLDAPDAVGGANRLLEIGLERPAVAGALRGVVSQRLVRAVCDACAEPIRGEMTESEVLLAKRFDLRPPIRGVGCRRCAGTGYRGRRVVPEVLVVNRTTAERIAAGAGDSELREAARSSGMRTLRQVGLERVRAGETTLDELARVLPSRDEPADAPAAPPVVPAEDPAPLIAEAARPDADDVAEVAEVAEVASTSILVVDDDPEDRLLVRTLLQKGGFEVEEARRGPDALERIRGGAVYGLVVLDLEMPDMDGREVLTRLRSADPPVSVPVIVMTGSPDPEDEARVMARGANDYLRKPVDPLRFVARVKATLRRARLERSDDG